MKDPIIVFINNTGSDISMYAEEIRKSLLATGKLPEELSDLFVVSRSPVLNRDYSPRFILDAA